MPGRPGPPGSVSQVRAAVLRMSEVAKATGVPVLLVGHVTKEGAIAGPRTLEHMVDVVLYLEGDRLGEHRMLRGIKNRFGATGEVGLLTMERDGMRDLAAPSRGMLDAASLGASGSVLTITCDGLRPMAVEVQALAVPSPFALPRRTVYRLRAQPPAPHARRARQARRHLRFQAGRVRQRRRRHPSRRPRDRPRGGAGDRRVDASRTGRCRATARSSESWASGGEVRRVSRTEVRLAEAAAVGMEAVILPESYRGAVPDGLRCHRVRNLIEAVALLG